MNALAISFALLLPLSGGLPALAQAPLSHAQHSPAAASADLDVPAAAEAAVAVTERFNTALSSGDLGTVETLLAPDVLILESGGAERSREEYMSHHAPSDAAFLKSAHRQLLHQRARTAGEFAWVGTESELHAQKNGMPLTVLSVETMVLKQTADGWRIVHIHWSSRTKP
jgi:ketosteroid isomerase-like protein